MTDNKAYVWAWQHHSLTVREEGNLDEAVRSAWGASEGGYEALKCIEVPAEGCIYDRDAVEELWKPLKDASWAAAKAAPTYVATVVVRSLDGTDSGTLSWHTSVEAAQVAADNARMVFDDRVTVRRLTGLR